MRIGALKRSASQRIPGMMVPGARVGTIPGFVEPCDPTRRARAPSGRGWIYEVKTDGYRAQGIPPQPAAIPALLRTVALADHRLL